MEITGNGLLNGDFAPSSVGNYRGVDYVTVQNQAFFRGRSQEQTASEYTHIQLFNPAGSGVVVFIDRVLVSVSLTSQIRLAWYNTELANSVGTWFSKDAGGAAGNAILRQDSNAGLLGTLVLAHSVLANTPTDILLGGPIKLDAGEGFLAQIATVNQPLQATFFGREF